MGSSSNTHVCILEKYTKVVDNLSAVLDDSEGKYSSDLTLQGDSDSNSNKAIYLEIGKTKTDMSKSEGTKYFRTLVKECVPKTEELYMIVDITLLSRFLFNHLISRQYYFLDRSSTDGTNKIVRTDDPVEMYGDRVMHEVGKYV